MNFVCQTVVEEQSMSLDFTENANVSRRKFIAAAGTAAVVAPTILSATNAFAAGSSKTKPPETLVKQLYE